MLAINIHFVGGTARLDGRAYREAGRPEWPPHPDRLFMALVAGAFRGRNATASELQSLRWVESQQPPQIVASEADERPSLTAYLPTNDRFDVVRKNGTSTFNRNKAKVIASCTPQEPLVSYVWDSAPPDEIRNGLESIAARVTYVGSSESMVTCTISSIDEIGASWVPSAHGSMQMRVPYDGRLDELQACHNAGIPPSPAAWIAYRRTGQPLTAGSEWNSLITLELTQPMELAATVRMAASVRSAMLAMCSDPLPDWISGHTPDGDRLRDSHVAVLPLPDVGGRHSTGRVLGIGIAVPKRVNPSEAADVLAPFVGGRVRVTQHAEAEAVREARKSLLPQTWTRPSCRWATVTPMTLARWPKGDSIDSHVIRSITLAGLPTPSRVKILNRSAFRGGLGTRMLDAPHRYRVHAVIEWEEPVSGPIVVGANRYQGVGLCKAI